MSDFVKEILDDSGILALYRSDGDTDRLDNIKELQSSIMVLENEDAEKISIEDYLQEIAPKSFLTSVLPRMPLYHSCQYPT